MPVLEYGTGLGYIRLSVRRSVPGTGAGEAAMWASRKSATQGPPRRRHLGLRLLLIVVVVLFALYVLPSPWAFHIGGKFSPFGEWDGYGPVQASNGGHYLLYTQLRGGLLNNHGHGGCSFHRLRHADRHRRSCAPGAASTTPSS